jgi:Fe-S cluster assembly ATP-binding protein
MMLKISNLSAGIENKTILSDINLNLMPGSVLLITGHNGSGKSTLLHAIMGRPDITVTGSVMFDDCELLELACHDRAKQGVFMFHQSPPAIEGVNTMTLYNEINNLSQNKITKRDLLDVTKLRFQQMNLPSDWAKRQFNVGASGGERKKNELALALFCSSKLLLLDEPDSGLEQASRDRINDLITKNTQAGGYTLLVTHDRELQQKYQHNSIELENGRIIAVS